MTEDARTIGPWNWPGLAAGPAARGVSTQLNYALAPFTCEQARAAVPEIAFVLFAAVIAVQCAAGVILDGCLR